MLDFNYWKYFKKIEYGADFLTSVIHNNYKTMPKNNLFLLLEAKLYTQNYVLN